MDLASYSVDATRIQDRESLKPQECLQETWSGAAWDVSVGSVRQSLARTMASFPPRVLGVAAAHATHSNILEAGVAGLVAGAMSMVAGEYVSAHSQADIGPLPDASP